MILDHPAFQPFEPILRSIHKKAFTTGIQVLDAKGKTILDIKDDHQLFAKFIRGCHKGYQKAQNKIADVVISLEEHINNNIVSIKSLRSENKMNPTIRELEMQIMTARNRILVLRRMYDAIVFTLFMQRKWIINRLGDYKRSGTKPHRF